MPFELQIALRYLLGRRRQAFISIISFVSTLGVTVGVLALIVAMAMMTGLQSELRDRILGSTAHTFVFKTTGIQDYRAEIEALRKVPRVVGAAPALIGRAMASSPSADAFISFKGIDPELEATVTEIEKSMVAGQARGPEAAERGATTTASCSARIWRSSSAWASATRITLLTPQGTLNPFTGMAPRTRPMRVAGIFRLGLYEVDNTFGLRLARRRRAHAEQDAARDDPAGVRRHLCRAGRGGEHPANPRRPLRHAGLDDDEPAAVRGAVAREDGRLDHHRPHRHGGRAQHRRVARAARDGEDARHRHPEDDGGDVAQRDVHLHAAGAHHRVASARRSAPSPASPSRG